MNAGEFWLLPVPLLALGTLGIGLWLVHRHWSIHPELLRKAMHVGTGLICLGFPWLFTTPWPVLLLAIISGLVLWSLRHLPADGRGIAAILHGVSRRSAGELYFPLSVVLLFLLSHDEPLYFVIPVLVLTLADAIAALIGLRYGLSRYHTEEGHKSVEGSVAFFLVAFMASHVPLLLLTGMGRLETLLLASVIGLLVMMLEAIAWSGLDNLFIPLGTWALLMTYRDAPADQLLEVLIVTLALIAVIFFWRRHTTLTDSSLFASVLVGYTAWSVGGLAWVLPPLLVFLSYTGLARLGKMRIVHDVRAVGSTVAAGMVCLLGQVMFDVVDFYAAYVMAFATQLALISLSRIQFRHPAMGRLKVLSLATLQGWLIVIVPIAALASEWPAMMVYIGLGLPLVGMGAALFQCLQPGLGEYPMDGRGWRRQAIIGAIPAVLVAVFINQGGGWLI